MDSFHGFVDFSATGLAGTGECLPVKCNKDLIHIHKIAYSQNAWDRVTIGNSNLRNPE
jgi:hypothetical protein